MSQLQPSFENRQRWQTRPTENPVMYQSWQKLLFAHWKFDPVQLQKLLPPGLFVDTWDGDAWVGVVPFFMRNIRPCWSPVVPWISNFLELNLRTYVYDKQGTPGVWFFSLSANRGAAVALGRSWFHLPYYWSKMSATENAHGWINYQCCRFADNDRRISHYKYRGVGNIRTAADNTLEFFLVERYLLFSQMPDGQLCTGQVHHIPYQIQTAELDIWDENVLAIDNMPVTGKPPDHVLFAPGVDVEVFGLKTSCSEPLV